MERLTHVIPNIEYKEKGIAYIQEHIDYHSEINGSGGLDRYINDYESWLKKLDQDKLTIPNEERVPSETYYLVRQKDKYIIGMINIRLVLNKKLQKCGGHIGYGIRPTERQKGYNKINLYLALLRCQELGIKEVYLDCDYNNPGSYKTMEALGGIRINEYESEYHQGKIYRYKINVEESISNNYKRYESKVLKLK